MTEKETLPKALKDCRTWTDEQLAATLTMLKAGRICHMGAQDECGKDDMKLRDVFIVFHGEKRFVSCATHATLYEAIEGTENVESARTEFLISELNSIVQARFREKERLKQQEAQFRNYLRRHIAARDNVAEALVEDRHIDERINNMSSTQIQQVKDMISRPKTVPMQRTGSGR